jgi:hypothetical protein
LGAAAGAAIVESVEAAGRGLRRSSSMSAGRKKAG